MKQAQPSTTAPEAALRPVSGQKTATGVFDTWSGANLWERQAFTTELQWGVRYSQSDPVGEDPGFGALELLGNLYSYAESNPLRMIDALGLTPQECCPCPNKRWRFEGRGSTWGVNFEYPNADGVYRIKGNVTCLSRVTQSFNLKGRCKPKGFGTGGFSVFDFDLWFDVKACDTDELEKGFWFDYEGNNGVCKAGICQWKGPRENGQPNRAIHRGIGRGGGSNGLWGTARGKFVCNVRLDPN